LKGTITASVASLTQLVNLHLCDNALAGLVPPLPFKQYSGRYGCLLGAGSDDDCTGPNCNHFKCPLPAACWE
jgi:hypothetical protein